MYLWQNTPLGNVALLSGPSIEGTMFEMVEPHQYRGESELILQQTRRNPELVALPAEYRTVLKGDQANICVANDEDETDCFTGSEGSQLYQAATAYRGAYEKAVQAFHHGQPLPKYKEQGTTIPCPQKQIIFDGMGRKYLTTYHVFTTKRNGSGPVIPSNDPTSPRLSVNPEYPPSLQARDLSTKAEILKIVAISNSLDPSRLLIHHADATLGSPVVWQGEPEHYYVLGGNGRTIAILKAPEKVYDQYDEEGAKNWGALWPKSEAPERERHILVRVITHLDGRNLTLKEATQFAGASQMSTSGAETPIRKAVSFIRGIGLDTSTVPFIKWFGDITADNVQRFSTMNAEFTREVLATLDPSQRNRTTADLSILADVLSMAVAGYLPSEIIASGLNSPKEEEALLGILPGLLQLQWRVTNENLPEKWNLLPHISHAKEYLNQIRNMSYTKALEWTEIEIPLIEQQKSMFAGAEHPLKGITPLGLALGLFIKKAMGASDPASKAKALENYIKVAQGQTPTFFGGAPPLRSPVVVLAKEALGARLSKKFLTSIDRVYGLPDGWQQELAEANPYRRGSTKKCNPYSKAKVYLKNPVRLIDDYADFLNIVSQESSRGKVFVAAKVYVADGFGELIPLNPDGSKGFEVDMETAFFDMADQPYEVLTVSDGDMDSDNFQGVYGSAYNAFLRHYQPETARYTPEVAEEVLEPFVEPSVSVEEVEEISEPFMEPSVSVEESIDR